MQLSRKQQYLVLACALVTYYLTRVVSRVKLVHAKLTAHPVEALLKRCLHLKAWYLPHPVAGLHGLLHTVLAPFLRKAPSQALDFDRQFIKHKDGGSICLSWARTKGVDQLPDSAPILFLLPGVMGDDRSWYFELMCVEAAKMHAWRPVVYIRRGCLIPMTSARSQDFCDGLKPDGDFELAITTVRARYPHAPLLGLGVSMGGNFLANYLGSRGADAAFHSACALGTPFDNVATSFWMEHQARLVDWALRKYKIAALEMNRHVIEQDAESLLLGVSVTNLTRAASYREQCEFDNFRFWGKTDESFNGYLDRASCMNSIAKICKPMLFMCSEDDPVAFASFIPKRVFENTPWAVLALTAAGGHHAYLELDPRHALPFGDRVCLEWLSRSLESESSG